LQARRGAGDRPRILKANGRGEGRSAYPADRQALYVPFGDAHGRTTGPTARRAHDPARYGGYEFYGAVGQRDRRDARVLPICDSESFASRAPARHWIQRLR